MSRELGIEVFDELPASTREGGGGGGRTSETAKLVEEVIGYVNSGEIPAGKPVRIAVYDVPGGAAGCAGQLKRKFGKPSAYGVQVNTRKTKNEAGDIEGYSVFVMVDPSWIVPGDKETADAEYVAYNTKMREKAAARELAKANGEAPKKSGRKKAAEEDAVTV